MAVREGVHNPSKSSTEPGQELFAQRKRPELGRFLLQVDRQTKGSYTASEAAEEAGLAIKIGYPLLQVVVYDAIDCLSRTVELPRT